MLEIKEYTLYLQGQVVKNELQYSREQLSVRHELLNY